MAHFENIQICKRWELKESLIDKEHDKQRQKEETYWANMLLRVIEVVKFLRERGLALHRDNHLIGKSNMVIYLGGWSSLQNLTHLLPTILLDMELKAMGIVRTSHLQL